MTDTLTVRIYNVRFGDAILVTVPDRDPDTQETTTRRILVDVGNVSEGTGTGGGGDDEVFEPVLESILQELGGEPLDLYVMTHEHLDHVQGLFYAATKLPGLHLDTRFKVNNVWLTGSAHPDYYDTHPDARRKKLEFDAMYRRLAAFLRLHAASAASGLMEILANNDPTKTAPCVAYLRGLSPARTTYLYRGVGLEGRHPFREATFSVWAPEEDTSDYYGSFQSIDGGAVPLLATGTSSEQPAPAPLADPLPPPGVDVGAFLNLVAARRSGIADNLLAIDQAANNTSVVFSLSWRGWNLLFPGDAEVRSWKTMNKKGVLAPVHFLKVAHHGSHNGTPADKIFDAILPESPPDAKPRRAAVSTWQDTYSGIPHPPTDARITSRCTLKSTLDNPDAPFYEIEFPG
ncbi:MAG: hypothetical protein HY825_19625 [Acidobacteria bacterium]|nr:hypothetical protein [Acidobacteriota bacterium]